MLSYAAFCFNYIFFMADTAPIFNTVSITACSPSVSSSANTSTMADERGADRSGLVSIQNLYFITPPPTSFIIIILVLYMSGSYFSRSFSIITSGSKAIGAYTPKPLTTEDQLLSKKFSSNGCCKDQNSFFSVSFPVTRKQCPFLIIIITYFKLFWYIFLKK